MPLDSLPGTMIVPLRTETRELYLRSFRVRNPSALTTENTFPWIDASCQADITQLTLRDAVVANNGVSLFTATGTALDQRLADLGLSRLSAVGGSGYVYADTSSGGSTIFEGDEIKEDASGLRFKCTQTALYQNGEQIPITGIDVGEQTNVDGGIVLTWTAPRPGCSSTAIVVTQADGASGITGGHGIESDVDAVSRAIQVRANPPASGNDAQYQSTGSETPGIAVQQIFTYPCILGAGATGFVFTLRPGALGQSRVPNGAQISAVLAQLVGVMPADDQIYAGTITEQPVTVVLKTTWARGASSWVDTYPWPLYFPNPGKAIIVQSATTSLVFTLETQNADYTSVTQPAIGQTIGFYDTDAQDFKRKKILSFTGTGPWVITCDTSNAASDISYTPVVGQRACPWSESLNQVPPAAVGYFDTLGPGEQKGSFFDAGRRQRRSPVSPSFYPHQLSNRMLVPILELAAIQDASIIEPSIPYSTTVGTPGVLSYLITLGSLAIFPLQ